MFSEQHCAPIAQSVEQMTLNHWVQGSSPCGRTIFFALIPLLIVFILSGSTLPFDMGKLSEPFSVSISWIGSTNFVKLRRTLLFHFQNGLQNIVLYAIFHL